MNNKGVFYLPREIEDLDIFTNPRRVNHLRVFLALASQARFQPGKVKDRVTGRDWPLAKGQLLFGRYTMADRLGMSSSTVRNIIDSLCADGLIRKEHVEFNHFTILSVAFMTFDKKDYKMCFDGNEKSVSKDNTKDYTTDYTTATNNNVNNVHNGINKLSEDENIISPNKILVTKSQLQEARELNDYWNSLFGTNLKTLGFAGNMVYWRQFFELDDIKRAIENLADAPSTFWMKKKYKPTPTFLFRTKNRNGSADYIQQCLDLSETPIRQLTKERYDYLKSKNSLTNSEADEFADLSLKFEGGQ